MGDNKIIANVRHAMYWLQTYTNTRHEVRIFCAICAAKVRLNFSLTEFSQLESDVILALYRKWRQRLI